MKRVFNLAVAIGLIAGAAAAEDKRPDPKPERITYKVIGLFDKDREPVLRAGFQELKDVQLIAVDFDEGEITLEFVPTTAFPGTKPQDIAERLNQRVRQATHHTIGVKPRRTVPRDKLRAVVIPAAGLDCKACCLAAYEIVAQIDGVEQATVSFKEGRVTALINPLKTDCDKIREALRKRGVDVGTAEKK